ncbi:MAG: ABC transporter permease [Candidatus Kapabacteria bacterium]|nr:ABC transporter permease [Candidatus Kapabacteria bacterium]
MITLVSIELYKIFRKWRTYISFITLAVLSIIIQLVMYFQGQNFLDTVTRGLQQNFVISGNFLNGYLIAYFILNMITIHIPFLITLVAGDLLAGEATGGTYRLILSRPVSRLKFILSKFIAGIIYTNLLILFLALVSLGLGILIFGTGELIVLRDIIIIFPTNDILWRFFIAYGFAALSMSVVTTLAFLFSSFVENAIGPIVATMAVIIVFLIISSIDLDFFNQIKPFMFTYYMLSWMDIFDDPINLTSIIQSGIILLGHIIIFLTITILSFERKDILS